MQMNTELKERVRREFYLSSGKINSAILRKDRYDTNSIWLEVVAYTNFLPQDSTPSVRLYCIANDITSRPICKTCGKYTRFIPNKKEFSKSCGNPACTSKITTRNTDGTKSRQQVLDVKNKFKVYCQNLSELKTVEQCIVFIQERLDATELGFKHEFVNRLIYKQNMPELASIIKHTEPLLHIHFDNPEWSQRFYILMNGIDGNLTCEYCGKRRVYINYKSGYSTCSCQASNIKFNVMEKIVDRIQKQGFDIVEQPKTLQHGEFTLKCRKCGKIVHKRLLNAKWKSVYCEGCYGDIGVSTGEKSLTEYIKTIYHGEILENWKMKNHELDIYLPELSLGIEYDGIYWHRECSDATTLREKTEMFNKMNIDVVHIFDTEWIHKSDIVKSMISNRIGSSKTRIYARKCVIKSVSQCDKRVFLDENHIQGNDTSTMAYGLYFNDVLVSIMTFGRRKITGGNSKLELMRFCSVLGCSVVGGASKLFKHFETEHMNMLKSSEITTYANARYSKGGVYSKLGFEFKHQSDPNYWYVKSGKVYHRSGFQKHNLRTVLPDFDKNLTEWENMYNNGYNRVWDCGNHVFIKKYV